MLCSKQGMASDYCFINYYCALKFSICEHIQSLKKYNRDAPYVWMRLQSRLNLLFWLYTKSSCEKSWKYLNNTREIKLTNNWFTNNCKSDILDIIDWLINMQESCLIYKPFRMLGFLHFDWIIWMQLKKYRCVKRCMYWDKYFNLLKDNTAPLRIKMICIFIAPTHLILLRYYQIFLPQMPILPFIHCIN